MYMMQFVLIAVCRIHLGGQPGKGSIPGPNIGPARLNRPTDHTNSVGTLLGWCKVQTHTRGSVHPGVYANYTVQYSKLVQTVQSMPHGCGILGLHEYI